MKRFFLIVVLLFDLNIITLSQKVYPVISENQQWNVKFSTEKLHIHMNSIQQVTAVVTTKENYPDNQKFEVHSENPKLASVTIVSSYVTTSEDLKIWSIKFNVTAHFLGTTKIYIEQINSTGNSIQKSENKLQLIITREDRVIDHIFTGSVALLVSLLYINFGAALDLDKLKGFLLCPIGPIIGLTGQFILMPLISYILGYILFSDAVELHLGLFFTGVSPGGGASNIWTVILQGNINLSIAMTTISNLVAFGMIPFWIFTLGQTIFDRANLEIPYEKIATFAIALIVPLIIGIAIQKYSPKCSRILVRLLKPISFFLIIFIVIFAIITNLYLFQLFSWKIVIAGLGLPWLGYILSWLIAKICNQPPSDAITIAIETGIQNTGIAIFLLRFSLDQPAADLTTVIPVAVAIMTPIPLAILYGFRKCVFYKKNKCDSTALNVTSAANLNSYCGIRD